MMFDTGTKVKIVGLESEDGKKLNGLEGVIDHYSNGRERYAVSLPGQSELKMIKADNVELLEATGGTGLFADEAEMVDRLKGMGMPPAMLQNLTPEVKKQMFEMAQRQDILERAKQAYGIKAETEEMKEAANGLYSWSDSGDHVYIEVPVNKEDEDKCNCEITPDTVSISIADKKIMQGDLFQKVNPKECKSEVKDGKLAVTLAKAANMRWLMIVR